MNVPLFLFCGGPSIYGDGRPKPLMDLGQGRSLIVHFLHHLQNHRKVMPSSVTLLCDDGQVAAIEADVCALPYPVPIHVLACGPQSNTFHKFERALQMVPDKSTTVQFGYPDIFFFGEYPEPDIEALSSTSSVHISAATLTSRFPRLIVDVYNNEIKGISNYSSPVPANPMHVFGGDLWGKVDELSTLAREFRSRLEEPTPSLEYDFFFWLTNQRKMRCVMLFGDRIWVDSARDVRNLMARSEQVS